VFGNQKLSHSDFTLIGDHLSGSTDGMNINAPGGGFSRFLPKGKYKRGVGVLVVGNIISQVLLLLATPLLSRLYSPAEFGLLSLFTATIAIVGSVVCGRYEFAVALPKQSNESSSVVATAILIAFVISPIAGYSFALSPLASSLYDHGLSKFFVFASVTVGSASTGLFSVHRYWGIRQEQYGTIAISRVVQSFVRLAIQCIFYFGGAISLILGNLLSFVIGATFLRFFLKNIDRVEFKEISSAAYRYRQFPIFSIWSALLNTSGRMLPIFAFVTLFGVSKAGLYALADRVVSAPVSMISSAVAGVFLGASAKALHNNSISKLVVKTHNQLCNLALAPFLMLGVTAPSLFGLIFGNQWSDAGVIVSWLTLYLYFSFVAAPMTLLFQTLEKQDLDLLLQLVVFAARALAIYVGAKLGGFTAAVASYSLVSVLYYMYAMWWGCTAAKVKFSTVCRQTIITFLWAMITVSPCIYMVSVGSSTTVLLMGIAVSSVLILARVTYLQWQNSRT